jgi:hypothetical protein
MIRKHDILNSIQIASPCHASWEAMEGDSQVRHCGDCKLNVYDISEMSREEATMLIREREGRLCVRLHVRSDGTVITRDCPTGLRAARRKAALALAHAFVLVLGLLSITSRPGRASSGLTQLASQFRDANWRANLPLPMRVSLDLIDPLRRPAMMGSPASPVYTRTMGMMIAPPSQTGATMGKVAVTETPRAKRP